LSNAGTNPDIILLGAFVSPCLKAVQGHTLTWAVVSIYCSSDTKIIGIMCFWDLIE